jgi:hypothetical protein
MKILSLLCFPMLILATAFEIVKRIVTIPLYPLAYWRRKQCRPIILSNGTELKARWFHFPLWLMLDDSIHKASLARGFDIDYCDYGKREPLGFITEKLKDGPFKEFMRSWNWGAVRNNCINLRDWLCAGPMLFECYRIGAGKSFYTVRRFDGIALPYLEIWIRGTRFQCGWLTSGIFQVQFRSLK